MRRLGVIRVEWRVGYKEEEAKGSVDAYRDADQCRGNYFGLTAVTRHDPVMTRQLNDGSVNL
jgi:hypothetical protein